MSQVRILPGVRLTPPCPPQRGRNRACDPACGSIPLPGWVWTVSKLSTAAWRLAISKAAGTPFPTTSAQGCVDGCPPQPKPPNGGLLGGRPLWRSAAVAPARFVSVGLAVIPSPVTAGFLAAAGINWDCQSLERVS